MLTTPEIETLEGHMKAGMRALEECREICGLFSGDHKGATDARLACLVEASRFLAALAIPTALKKILDTPNLDDPESKMQLARCVVVLEDIIRTAYALGIENTMDTGTQKGN